MRTFTKEQLAELLAKHRAWLNNEDGGERANPISADLSSADLRPADLRYADLSFLQSANGKELACMNAGKYQVVLSKERIAIGCKLFTVGEWKEFNDATISMMDDGALEWWIKWKDLVFMFHKNIFG